jgi:hypothetical protein
VSPLCVLFFGVAFVHFVSWHHLCALCFSASPPCTLILVVAFMRFVSWRRLRVLYFLASPSCILCHCVSFTEFISCHVLTACVILLDMVSKPKSVTLAFNRLVIEECIFDGWTVLFGSQFDESVCLENFFFC